MSSSGQICRQFSLDEIKSATRNFDDELIIGEGGFGSVYRGSIDNGAKIVAIKRLSCESKQGETEFLREIQTLSKLQHENLVRLEGYCNESPEKILVYEYMQNGTLVDHLYKFKDSGSTSAIGDDQPSRLTWVNRLNICIGAARGLDFLHRRASPGVIHRDIKGSNILLDGNFVAKIADFGLAKLVKSTSDPKITSVSTTIPKGTFGYMAPEYLNTETPTTETDIYAFGVVLLVVLSGRPALDKKAEKDQRSLSQWATKCIEKDQVDLIIDPYLIGRISSRSLKQFVRVSLKCVHTKSEQRPTMEEVVAGLELALSKQPLSGRKRQLEEMALAEADVARLERKVAELHHHLNQRRQNHYGSVSRASDHHLQGPNHTPQQKYFLQDFDSSLAYCNQERKQRTKDIHGTDMRNVKDQILISGSSNKHVRKQFSSDSKNTNTSTNTSMDELGAVDSAYVPSSSKPNEAMGYQYHRQPTIASSTSVELTSRLDFFKERRSQLMEQLHNLDINYGTIA